ncbi:hypothetical protein PF003_g11530 [Phytophthora fragariae]|nr:hypothetical protein PF003_g11530 [Phytophthora fragariae]
MKQRVVQHTHSRRTASRGCARDPKFVIVAEFYSKNHPTSCSSSSGHSAAAGALSTPSRITSARHTDVLARNKETEPADASKA